MSATTHQPAGIVGFDFVAIPRALAERLLALTERVLAFSGEPADRDLIKIQHELAGLLTPPAAQPSEPPTSRI